MPRYWTPKNSRQQFWGSLVSLGFGMLLFVWAAWMGWQAYRERQLQQGEVALGRVTEARRNNKNFHLFYEFEAKGQTWQGKQFGSSISSSTWDELQRTGKPAIRYLPLNPAVNGWEPALPSQAMMHIVLCIMLSAVSALVVGISCVGLRRSAS